MLNEIDAYLTTGHLSEARKAIKELARLQIKENPCSAALLALVDRDPDALQAVISRNAADAWDLLFQRVWNTAMIPYLRGDFAEAREIISALKRGRATSVLQGHMIALIERDFDTALDHYADPLELGYWFAYVRAQLNYRYRLTFPASREPRTAVAVVLQILYAPTVPAITNSPDVPCRPSDRPRIDPSPQMSTE